MPDTTNYSMKLMNTIFIEPIALIDGYNGSSLRIGTEYSFNRRYTVTATVGTYFSMPYYMLKLEAKRYFDFNADERYYLSLQYFYKHNNHILHDYIPDSLDRNKHIEDVTYHIEKFATGISLNGGYVKFHKHGLIIEGYTGIGMRYRVGNLHDITHDKQELLFHYHEDTAGNFTDSPGTGWIFEILLGMRIGWRYK